MNRGNGVGESARAGAKSGISSLPDAAGAVNVARWALHPAGPGGRLTFGVRGTNVHPTPQFRLVKEHHVAKKSKAKKKTGKKKGAKKAAKKTKKKARRTTHRSGTGKKLYAVRKADGTFKDIQTYQRAHAADLRQTSAAEKAG